MFDWLFNFIERKRLYKHLKKLTLEYMCCSRDMFDNKTYHISNVSCKNKPRFYCTPVQCIHVTNKGKVIDGGWHFPGQGLCPYLEEPYKRLQLRSFNLDRDSVKEYIAEKARVNILVNEALNEMENFVKRHKDEGENTVRA